MKTVKKVFFSSKCKSFVELLVISASAFYSFDERSCTGAWLSAIGHGIISGNAGKILCCRMEHRYHVLAFSGSTRTDSVNELVMKIINDLSVDTWNFETFNALTSLPYFNQDQDQGEPPPAVKLFRNKIAAADGVLICTPEYVFSLPGVLKNAIEWTVSTTLFSEKPVALITASSSGVKAHEALLMIFKTIYAKVEEDATLLISGAKAKIKNSIEASDPATISALQKLVTHLTTMMQTAHRPAIRE